ncbi:MAG: recombinase family protein [Pirellulales bacterium]|nr:recombinase family protein [Pirellulales bacterium]
MSGNPLTVTTGRSRKTFQTGHLAAGPSERSLRSLRSAKIQDRHLECLAVVYVRQSSPQQVLDHQESRARQYALADHAVTLGWSRDRVLVIDEDQGHSGRSSEQRDGFQRLLSEVTLGHVGLVLGLEMSRLARSSKDWHNLLEICALFGALLGDQDGLYNPNDTNDRLLLGLKGTMSEYEMFTMRNRLQLGRLHKAERGELYITVPRGYLKLPAGHVIIEPDEQARAAVQLVFEKFAELGSQYAVFRYFIQHNIRFGIRVRSGPRAGELEWRRATATAVGDILHHPIYAGAYVFGRRPAHRPGPRARHLRVLPMEEWQVLKRDHLPAYITWEQYLANVQKLRENRPQPNSAGVPRQGAALLSGLLVCRTCGRRMRPDYRKTGHASYVCLRHLTTGQPKTCVGLNAAVLDALVAQQVLHALAPAALDLSLQTEDNQARERHRLQQHWRRQLERARYEVDRAERQYQAVEPEHRLVARTLETRWEEALAQLRQLQEESDRALQNQSAQLTEQDRCRIRKLASDLPALWHAVTTSAAERKEIVRCLVDRVVVLIRDGTEYVDVTLHWQGGFQSQHEIVRPVGRYAQMRDFDRLLERLADFRKAGINASTMAEKLNQEGFTPPKRRGQFSKELVRQLLCRQGLSNEKTCLPPLGTHEWWLPALARELQIPTGKLRGWIKYGWLHSRQTPAQHLWIIWADDDELYRLRQLAALSKPGVTPYPPELTTPKCRTENR